MDMGIWIEVNSRTLRLFSNLVSKINRFVFSKALHRWVGPAKSLVASASTIVKTRIDSETNTPGMYPIDNKCNSKILTTIVKLAFKCLNTWIFWPICRAERRWLDSIYQTANIWNLPLQSGTFPLQLCSWFWWGWEVNHDVWDGGNNQTRLQERPAFGRKEGMVLFETNNAGGVLLFFRTSKGGANLDVVQIKPEDEGKWNVEQDFIDSIRNSAPVRLTNFRWIYVCSALSPRERQRVLNLASVLIVWNSCRDGVRYMDFTQAVFDSYSTGNRVILPIST